MMKAIRDAGFTPVPDDVTMIVTGTLESGEGHCVLILDRMKEPRSLTCLSVRPGDALERALAQSAGRAVQIHGRWLFEGQGRLQVESVEDPPAPP